MRKLDIIFGLPFVILYSQILISWSTDYKNDSCESEEKLAVHSCMICLFALYCLHLIILVALQIFKSLRACYRANKPFDNLSSDEEDDYMFKRAFEGIQNKGVNLNLEEDFQSFRYQLQELIREHSQVLL